MTLNENLYALSFDFSIVHFYFARYIDKCYKGRTILCNGRDTFITYNILKHIFKRKDVHYLSTSRKALLNTGWDVNYPVDHEKNKFIYESIIFGRYKNVCELLKYLGLWTDNGCCSIRILSKMCRAGFKTMLDDIRPFQENHAEIQDKIKTLVNSLQGMLYDYVKPKHESEAKKYLEDRVKNNSVFIDVGWNKTTQYLLENLLDVKLQGVYFETFTGVVKLPKEVKSDKFMKSFNNTCRGIQGLLEGCFFTAPHGSVDYYSEGEAHLQHITREDYDIKEALVNGALDRCKELYERGCYDLPVPEFYLEEKCERLFFKPTLEEVTLINKVNHNSCGYGYSVVNYNEEYNEIDFKRSFWKQGYTKLSGG